VKNCVAALGFALLATTGTSAQDYPSRPVTLIVPYAAGGGNDVMARIVAEKMSRSLGQQIVIENKGGAGGVIANEQVARAPADGKTLLFATLGSAVISPALRPQLSYDPLKSFTPVAFIGQAPSLIVVAADYPAKTFADLVAKAKAEKLSYGSAGAGTTMNIAGEMFNAAAGVKTAHVPYRGAAPAINDLIGGHIQFLNADLPVLLPLVQSGKLRALVNFGAERSPLLPDVPTTAELGFSGMLMENWYGVLGPVGLAPDVLMSLETAVLDAVKSPAIANALAAGGARGATDSKGFAAKLAKDVAYWGPEIKKLGISGE